tara:strand:+ start:635 stop:1006 length:372 start_codon:yes stop_codon:yes gene_type:complete
MKKITKTIASLLLATQLNAQTDTICEMVRGKCNYKFDYTTCERLIEYDTCNSVFKSSLFKIDTNNVLYLYLYDEDIKCFKRRKLTLYFNNGKTSVFMVNSKDKAYYFSGKNINTIRVSSPKLF